LVKQINRKPLLRRKGIGECELRKVNRNLLVGSSIMNKEFLLSKLTEFWDNVDRFLEAGLGIDAKLLRRCEWQDEMKSYAYWSCKANNRGSIRVAQKLVFNK